MRPWGECLELWISKGTFEPVSCVLLILFIYPSIHSFHIFQVHGGYNSELALTELALLSFVGVVMLEEIA